MLYKCISYIIAYHSQANHHYIGITNHVSNLLWIHRSAARKPTSISVTNGFIFIFIKQILWQVLCHGNLILLLSTWQKEKNFFNPAFVSCSTWKLFLVVRSWYCNTMTIILVFVDILQRVFIALIEAENIYQKSNHPHFCDSIRNISIKNHRLYQRVARHMKNFLQIWYRHLVMPCIDPISLFQLTKHIGSWFNFFLVFLICIYSNLSSDISLNHIIMCILLFILYTIAWVCSNCTVCTRQYGTSIQSIFIKNNTWVSQGKIYVRPNLSSKLFC